MARRTGGRRSLHRVLGLPGVTASGVGIIIGAGIYVLLGPATDRAGGMVWVAFLIASALCALTALGYAELSSMFPRAGAEYEYTRQVFPASVAFIVGWTMVSGLVIAAAAIALGFARYLGEVTTVDVRFGAWALLALVAMVALAGIRQTAWIVATLTAVQVGGLVLVTVAGSGHIGDVDLLAGDGVSGVAAAAALVFFAFIGFDEVITLAEETENPTRTVPRAILLALLISTVLYVAVAIISVSVLTPDGLADSTRPLTDVMRDVVGGPAVPMMTAIALLTTANTTLLAVTAASRLTYGMADTGALPSRMAGVSARGVPTVTVLVAVGGAAAFVAFGDLTLVAGATDFAVYAVFLAVNATVIALRFRRPDAERPFRIPGAVGRVPVIPVLASIVTLAMVSQLDIEATAIGLGILLLGALVGAVLAAVRRRRGVATRAAQRP
jgi:APA family basic amino acid/polyamine antiporter